MRALAFVLLVLVFAAITVGLFLFRPFIQYPQPAQLTCLDPAQGSLVPLGAPGDIYGLGLSYSGHIAESPGLYDPGAGPPAFRKRAHSVNFGEEIVYPSRAVLLRGARNVDPGHSEALDALFPEIPALLDYEVEIGLVVVEDISSEDLGDETFSPPIGYFVANDVTARILIGMAPRFEDTVAYLAEGKGLPGFLPVGEVAWIPKHAPPDSWLCVDLRTEVNGTVRQAASSRDIILTPREILLAVARRFELRGFEADTWIVTGTPPGVASQVPGWLQRALALVDPDAETKLELMIGGAGSDPAYLRPGDVVTVSAELLGSKTSRIVR